MVLHADVVRRKLLAIEQAVSRLRAWLPVTAERLETDVLLQWAVERGLQIAAEALFDLGSHLLAGEFQETVDRYADVPTRLVARGVLRPETSERLRGLAGFRNVLVHDYAEVDLAIVAQGMQRLDDFVAFVADVERWMQSTGR
ncbi:MAG TPA: DUF86 domain-containing protein [Polyangiaceae bacterium]